MKIRVRLSLLFVLCSTLSLLLCGTLLLHSGAQNTIRSAETNALSELNMLTTSFGSAATKSMEDGLNETVRRSLIIYVFKSYAENTLSESQYILKHGDDTLYNNSGYAPEALLDGREYNTVSWQGEKLFAAGRETDLLREQYRIYLIRNMTSVYDSVASLRLQFAIICVISVVISAALILLITSRTLLPLKQLEQGAENMTNGDYQTRIPISESMLKRNDEITAVSKSFNRMADAVEQHLDEVTEVAEERKMLLGALTHELKTPMTSIIGYAESLNRTKLSEEQREESVFYIHREACRLERLTQKMMQLITLTDGEQIDVRDVSARQLFDVAQKTLNDTASRYNAALEYIENGEQYLMDSDLMAGVLINLVDNACSAGAKHIVLSAKENILSVSDDGCGMPNVIIEKVTQPFFRADKARSRNGGHAGLGLALAARIAELHRARLTIESEEGKGTTVSIVFGQSSDYRTLTT